MPFVVKEEQMGIRKVMPAELLEHSVQTTDILLHLKVILFYYRLCKVHCVWLSFL
jgi:hypothetical protein